MSALSVAQRVAVVATATAVLGGGLLNGVSASAAITPQAKIQFDGCVGTPSVSGFEAGTSASWYDENSSFANRQPQTVAPDGTAVFSIVNMVTDAGYTEGSSQTWVFSGLDVSVGYTFVVPSCNTGGDSHPNLHRRHVTSKEIHAKHDAFKAGHPGRVHQGD